MSNQSEGQPKHQDNIVPNSALPNDGSKKMLMRCKNLSYSYGNNFDISIADLTINENEILGIAGPNGAGKSTLMKLLLGLLKPNEGECTSNISKKDIAYVPQNVVIEKDLPLTVAEIAGLGLMNSTNWFNFKIKRKSKAITHALETVGLADMATSQFNDLSGGQKQRALIAKAFVGDPKLLILDEPTVGLDAKSQDLFSKALVHLLEDHNTSIILVEHDFSHVESIIDRMIIFNREVSFDGSIDELKKKGVNLGMHPHDLPLWLERNT